VEGSWIGTLYEPSLNPRRGHHGTLPQRKISPLPNGRAATDTLNSYFKNSKLDYPNSETPKASKKYVKAMKKLHVSDTIIDVSSIYSRPLQETIPPHTPFNRQFLDLLKKIFVYDPKKRITAKQALQHPWFKEALMDDGTEARKIRMEREKKRQRQAESRYQ
jgi:dual-specificity kinase